ncbi:hypothetical protein V6N13_025277 [Hibiscus sabdariffa]
MILYQVQQSEPKFQASRLFDFNSWVMFPYPPPSSDELLRSSNIRSPDSMAPPAVPSVRVLVDDQQAVKRGKTLATVDTIDTSKGMEIHNHPQASYAGIVSESGRQVASNTVPSLDDVIVESGDVIVDKTGLFPSGSVVDGHREELLSDATVAVPSTSEEEVYGPWMHANTRHWQPRKDVGRSKGMASRDAVPSDRKDGAPISGSTPGDHERAAKAVLRGTGASLPELPVISVAFDGDRRISDEAGLKVVNGNFQEPIPVVSSMGNQAPQVVSHVVQNVADWLSSGSDHMGIGSVGTRVSANQSNVVIDIKEGTKRGVGIGSFEATASDIDRGTFTVSGAMKMSTLDPDLGRENNEVLTATAVTDTTSTSRRS